MPRSQGDHLRPLKLIMNQTLTGNATIASGERILQHAPRPKTLVKVTVLLAFDGEVDVDIVGETASNTLEWEYYENNVRAGSQPKVQLLGAEIVQLESAKCPTENT